MSQRSVSVTPLQAPSHPGASQVTQTVRAGIECGDATGCVVPPLHLTATFAFRGFAEKRAYDYTRSGNPTRDLLGEALAELEQGAGAVVTASGMAAITVVGYLLPCGGRIVAPHDCYGGTYRLFDAWRRRGEREVEFVDFADEAALSAALSKPTALLWIETPSNPLLRITDIAAVARAGKACGALIAVDNTFLSPAWQQPLALGADLVVHSTTKYLNGHSDVVGGAAVARERSLHEQLAWWANCLGLTGAPFDSYLTLRGLRTLHARLDHHGRNALALQPLGEGERVASMVVEARVQRPQSPQRQVTVERRAGQPEAIRPPGELLVQRALARHYRAADHVAVAVQVLGGRMHYEVCPERERLLPGGREEGVVHRDQRPAGLTRARDRGDVGDSQQRVARGLDPQQRRGLRERGGERRLIGDRKSVV